MAVDLSTPLTKEEAAYLDSRGRTQELEAAAERHDQNVADLLNTSGDGTAPTVLALNSDLQAIQSPEVLLARLREMGVNVKVDDSADVDDEDDSDVAPYEQWSVPELDAELKRRNLPVTGNKQAKAESLYADDAKA
jgi:hypothetical protein